MGAPSEVFLSHAHEDRELADELVRVLGRHGVRVWYGPAEIRGAQQWHDEIGRALARCAWFVLLLAPHAVRSVWVKRELLYALRKRSYRDRITPCFAADCDPEELSWTLPDLQSIDLRGRREDGWRALLSCWDLPWSP